jgi:hypothetical protein
LSSGGFRKRLINYGKLCWEYRGVHRKSFRNGLLVVRARLLPSGERDAESRDVQ